MHISRLSWKQSDRSHRGRHFWARWQDERLAPLHSKWDEEIPSCHFAVLGRQTHTGPRSALVMGWKRSAYALQEGDLARRTLTEVPWEHSVSLLNLQGRKRLGGDCSPLRLEAVTGRWELTSKKTTAKIRFWSQVPAQSFANLMPSDQKPQYLWVSVFPLQYIYWAPNNNNKLVSGILDSSLKELNKLRLHSRSLLPFSPSDISQVSGPQVPHTENED